MSVAHAPRPDLGKLDLGNLDLGNLDLELRFDEWIAPEAAFVRRVAAQYTRTASDADDLAQEVLTRAFRGISGFDGRYPRAWLRRIIANTAASNARRRRLDEVVLEYEPPVLAENLGAVERFRPDVITIDTTLDPALESAVTGLSSDHREIVELVDVKGLTYEEAAEALGVPIGTVMSRLHRARSRLREALRGTHLDRATSRTAVAPV